MPEIKSFVFFDIETTGLPFQENNQTKIIELSFVAAQRKQLEVTPYGCLPPARKLTLVFNPQRPIHPEVIKLTGISEKEVAKAPTFREKLAMIISFLEDLPHPVCLIAHNGNIFDFKILLAECNDASTYLPDDVFCIDSLPGFRRILKNTNINYSTLENPPLTIEDFITDDEDDDEWPDLNVSTEEWEAIDLVSLSLTQTEKQKQIKTEQKGRNMKKDRSAAIKKVFKKDPKSTTDKECFKLSALYKRLLNKDEENAHRAEADCMMLMQCVIAVKNDFLPWMDDNCKLLNEIKPLVRGVSSWKQRYPK